MYEVPRSKKSLKQNQFEFRLNGAVHRVPLMKFLKPGAVIRFRDGMNELEAAGILFEAIGQPELVDQFDDFDQVAQFMQAWQEASGVTVGESPASPAS